MWYTGDDSSKKRVAYANSVRGLDTATSANIEDVRALDLAENGLEAQVRTPSSGA